MNQTLTFPVKCRYGKKIPMSRLRRIFRVIYEILLKIPIELKVGAALVLLVLTVNNIRLHTDDSGSDDSYVSYRMTEGNARQHCFDNFDFNRGSWQGGSIQIWPWDDHPTKVFRIAGNYERRGSVFRFGCTVYKDGRADVNYVE